MKIVVNYDLIERIAEAKANPKFTLIRKQVKYYGVLFGFYVTFDFYVRNKEFLGALENSALSAILVGIIWNIIPGFSSIKETRERTTSEQLEAQRDLRNLISQMADRGVNTDLDLLYEAKEYKTEYKIVEEDEKKYDLEEKYIMLPTETFTGDIKDISLLQEHIMGSKEYILSLGSPKEVKQPKFAFR